ncbi:MAG: aminotransferase class I/II-fold pyridoxal phosphate-dependent enzyme [Flavobacteriales bacterium]|nr:aminotransferase class I/II-fold pyridoxal phosphate-dependent enzyme [Flavobacteriales bacterium]
MIESADRIANVQEYYFSKKLAEIAQRRKNGEEIINLGVGSPDLPPHPSVVKALNKSSKKTSNHGYQPYRGIPEFREAYVAWYFKTYGVVVNPTTEIISLMGSKEGVMHLSMAYINPGDIVLVPNPGYPTYGAAAKIAGADVRTYPFREDKPGWPDLSGFSEEELNRTKMFWINYPHMPTGQLATPELFENLVGLAQKHGFLLCHDNPYNGILNEKPLSIFSVKEAAEIGVELNSLSKIYNMAGWRVGCMIAGESIINTVLKFKTNVDSGMFKPTQLAAAKALQLEGSWMKELNETYRRRREIARQIFKEIGCAPEGDQGGLFVWARIPEDFADAEMLSEELLNKHQVFIAPGHIFGDRGAKHLRLSLCATDAVLAEAQNRLKNRKR